MLQPTVCLVALALAGGSGQEPAAPERVSLAQAVQVALSRNFGLLSSLDSERIARYNERVALSAFFPKVSPEYSRGSGGASSMGVDVTQKVPWLGTTLQASGTRTTFADTGTPLSNRSTDVRLSVTQPLLRGLGPTVTNFDLTNSRRALQGQQRQLELNRQQLAIDVARAFYQVQRERQLIEVSRQSLARSEALRDASQARMQVGLASRLDVLRAELQAAQAKDGVVSAETALGTALEEFRLLLGLGPQEPLEPEGSALPDVAPGDGEAPEALVMQGLQRRLELVEVRDQVTDAERSLKVARQSLLPQLDLNVSHLETRTAASSVDPLQLSDKRTTFFLSTSYPLERTADLAAAASAQLELEARRRAVKQREYQVASEIRTAVRNLEEIRKRFELQKQTLELAEQQHQLATLRYQRGLASNFDVVDAESAVVAARTALASLQADYHVGRFSLLKATGGLDVEKEFQP
jgi:outer membrane protein TolC